MLAALRASLASSPRVRAAVVMRPSRFRSGGGELKEQGFQVGGVGGHGGQWDPAERRDLADGLGGRPGDGEAVVAGAHGVDAEGGEPAAQLGGLRGANLDGVGRRGR